MPQAPELHREARFCPDCGYNLHGISSDRCPECGLDLRGLTGASIPWESRRHIGRMKAFYRTCMLAAFRPKQLAIAAFGPVDIHAAKRFHWLILTIATLAFAGALALDLWQRGVESLDLVDTNMRTPIDARWEATVLWSAGATLAPVLPVGAALTLVLGSWFPRLWAGVLPSIRRQRASALLCYCSAPLALSPICAALCAGQNLWGRDEQLTSQYPGPMLLLDILAVASTGLMAALWWWSAARVLAVTTHAGPGRSIAMAATIPIGWLVAAVIGLILLPCLVGLAWIAIDSLR
ncbi:MAG TPA: zinc ribbon domain-containing protein [Tepidisphaeraceae bacterium]|jgi:hypothetical protein|nr:zinc ribbon domain-containing protein [Tepidisphaeraceae bacterium]